MTDQFKKPRGRFNNPNKDIKKPQMRRLDAHERAIMEAMRSQALLSITMLSGKVYTGHVTEFDKYSVIVQLPEPDSRKEVLLKHAIASFGF